MKSPARPLLGQTRTAVLSALLLHPEVSLHVRELARLTASHAGSLHRELRALAEMGLLHRREIGRQVHYRANTDSPIFEELTGLLRKTAGMADVVRDALQPLADRIEAAFVYGSMATGDTHANSDVDVMVVGSVGFADVVRALEPAQSALRREINPTVLSSGEFAERRGQRDGFVPRIWKEPKLWLIGDQDEFG